MLAGFLTTENITTKLNKKRFQICKCAIFTNYCLQKPIVLIPIYCSCTMMNCACARVNRAHVNIEHVQNLQERHHIRSNDTVLLMTWL